MQIVLTTLPKDRAEEIKTLILEEKLAVCVLELESKSKYLWKGKIESDTEALLAFKTDRAEELKKRIKEVHPYEIPFIASIDIADVNEEYLEWLKEQLKS